MTKVSDTQIVILSAAAQREDRNVLPLPGSLRGGAAAKVVGALLARGLIVETTAGSRAKADSALNRIWRNDDEGRAILLQITDAGRAAIGTEPGSFDSTSTGAEGVPGREAPQETATEAGSAPKAGAPRAGTKQATLIEMLRSPEGATIEEIVATTGWQPHTVRGAMSGALKKKLGLEVTSEKDDARGRVYRIAEHGL